MSLGGVVSGLISSGQSLPTVDIGALLSTIAQSGQDQRAIINALPAQIQQQIQQYIQNNGAAASAYQAGITGLGNNLMSGVQGLYGPNSDAANAEKNADKVATYSTVPGTQDAVRNAMAATGGLERGQAGVALAQPYVQAAQTYAGQAAGVNAKQTAAGQNAQMAALQAVNSMDDTMFTNLFGMSKQQAQQILTTGNDALKDQLAQLITQNTNQTNQTLGVEGVAANNGYQNAVTRNQQQNAIWSGLANTALQGAGVEDSSGNYSGPSATSFMGGGSPAGMDTGSADYMRNAMAMATSMGMA